MKSQQSKSAQSIFLFLSTPSCSMLKVYKEKSDLLNQAIIESKMIKVTTYNHGILKLKKVGNDTGKYFGLSMIKGKMKKLILNINDIQNIILL